MKQHWLTALLILALIPYGVICFYALPFGDDFCFGWTAAENISFLQKFLNQYLHWNGRYTGDVLINLHPILTGKLVVLQTVLFVSLLCTPVAWYVLFAQLIHSRRGALVTSLLVTLFYLCYMPQLTEGIYWYGGIVNYHLGNVVLVLHVALELRLTQRACHAELVSVSPTSMEIPKQVRDDKSVLWRIVWQVWSVLLLITAIGFNEIAAVLAPLVYLLLTLYTLRTRHYMHKRFFWLLVVSVLAAGFVILAPGNMVRVELFKGQHKFFYSAFYALLQTGRFIARWIFNYPALALGLLLVVYANNWKQKLRLQVDWRVTAALAFTVLFLSAFIPYYATGKLGQHRTINYAFFFVMPLLAYSVLQFAVQYKWGEKLVQFKTGKLKAFLLASTVMALMATGNGILIIKDFAEGTFYGYKRQFMIRQSAVINGEKPYPLPVVPSVFRITDAADSTHWVSMCIENYYERNQLK